jgi:hypothetical protein
MKCGKSHSDPDSLILSLLRPFIDRLNEILVERSDHGIEPAPIVARRLEDDRAASAPDTHLLAAKAKLLRQPDRLGPPRPEEPRFCHCRLQCHTVTSTSSESRPCPKKLDTFIRKGYIIICQEWGIRCRMSLLGPMKIRHSSHPVKIRFSLARRISGRSERTSSDILPATPAELQKGCAGGRSSRMRDGSKLLLRGERPSDRYYRAPVFCL